VLSQSNISSLSLHRLRTNNQWTEYRDKNVLSRNRKGLDGHRTWLRDLDAFEWVFA
jgi:hypothetical protein